MENLNLENFWNPLKEKYPLAVEAFRKWIDKYKEGVKWNKLFGAEDWDGIGRPPVAPKFHEIPYEMQHGILWRFVAEQLQWQEGLAVERQQKIFIDLLRLDFFSKINEQLSSNG